MSDALDVVGLFRDAFAGGVLVALACGLLSVHVVARRMVTAGIALPQVAALGIALGLLLGAGGEHADGHASHAVEGGLPKVLAVALQLGLVAVLAWPAAVRAIGETAISGIAFAGAGALTILAMARSPLGMEEVHHLVEGNVLAVGRGDLVVLLATLVPVLVLLVAAARPLMFCTFDAEMAATLGVRTRLWQMLFHVAFALTVAVSIHAAGTLFMVAFLVLPGATGVLLGRSGWSTLVIAAAAAVVASAGGFVLSASAWDTPTGPTCAAAALAVFALASLVRLLPARS